MINISQLREKLIRNKIFFEIFASTFIGIGGVALAFASYVVSKESVKLTESQIYPSLFLAADQRLDNELISDEIQVVNAGGTARNLKISASSMLEVVIDKTGATKCIRLSNYFDFIKHDHSGSEVVALIKRKSPGNHTELKNAAPDVYPGHNPLYESVSVTTLLKLEYVRVGGKKIIEYFSFNAERVTPQRELTPFRFVTLPNRCVLSRDIRHINSELLNNLAK